MNAAAWLGDYARRQSEERSSQLTFRYGDNYPSASVSEAAGYPWGETQEINEKIADSIGSLVSQKPAVASFPFPAQLVVELLVSSLAPVGSTVLTVAIPSWQWTRPFSAAFRLNCFGANRESGLIDYAALRAAVSASRPAAVVVSASLYASILDAAELRRCSEGGGAKLIIDLGGSLGLALAGLIPLPLDQADAVIGSTEGLLRGPAGCLVLGSSPGIAKVSATWEEGFRHPYSLGTAVCLQEAGAPSYAAYAKQVLSNARQLAYSLMQNGCRLFGEGTDLQYVLVEGVEKSSLPQLHQRLAGIGMLLDLVGLPLDETSAVCPALRMDVSAATSRGMKEKEMDAVARIVTGFAEGTPISALQAEVASLARRFRIPVYH